MIPRLLLVACLSGCGGGPPTEEAEPPRLHLPRPHWPHPPPGPDRHRLVELSLPNPEVPPGAVWLVESIGTCEPQASWRGWLDDDGCWYKVQNGLARCTTEALPPGDPRRTWCRPLPTVPEVCLLPEGLARLRSALDDIDWERFDGQFPLPDGTTGHGGADRWTVPGGGVLVVALAGLVDDPVDRLMARIMAIRDEAHADALRQAGATQP